MTCGPVTQISPCSPAGTLLRTFTANLMAYALGRRVEYFDQPLVRHIVREAEANDYRMSSFVLGIVRSDAFQKQRVGTVADAASN